MIPGKQLAHWPRAMDVEREIDPKVLYGLPPDFGLETLLPRVQSRPALPGLVHDRRDAPVAPRQQSFEQTGLDVVLLDRDRPDLALVSQVLPGPPEVLARL